MKNNEIVVACLTLSAHDSMILRAAQRKARENNIPWHALYIEGSKDRSEEHLPARNRILGQLALAERMGATVTHIRAKNFKIGLADYFAEKLLLKETVSLIVAGETKKPSVFSPNSSPSTLLRKYCNGRCELLILPIADRLTEAPGWWEKYYTQNFNFKDVLYAFFAVLAAGLVTEVMQFLLPVETLGIHNANRYLIFLIACVVVAGRVGLIPGLISSVTSFVVIKFFYIPPLYQLRIYDVSEGLSLGLFLLAAVSASIFNSQVHAETEKSETNERRMEALLQIYKTVSHVSSRNAALQELYEKLQTFLNAETAFFLASIVRPNELQDAWPESPSLTNRDRELLERCWQNVRNGNFVSAYNRQTGWRFEPLVTANSELGVMAIRMPASESRDGSFEDYLRMVAELVASILEKIEAVNMSEDSRVRNEREKLRNMLLSSVSHDLKTPLASIIGSLSVHRSMFDRLTEAQRKELTDTALEEAQRLDSFVTNILDLAKIESGALKMREEWHSPIDMVLRVKKRLRLKLKDRNLVLTPADKPIEVLMDPLMSEHALYNVIDNAIKYTPSEGPIEVTVEENENGYLLHVRDYGSGIPEEEQERIFDKYTRLHRKDSQVAGTGLGLALARAVMRGQGGSISVETHPDGGAIFTLYWPEWRYAEVAKIQVA